MNANYSQKPCRRPAWSIAAILLLAVAPPAGAVLQAEHSLRYVGWRGWEPVSVEVTLRKRPSGLYEYREWTAPRWWAAVLGEPQESETVLRVDGNDYRPVSHRSVDGKDSSLEDLDEGTLDPLSVRLEARAAVAAGRDHVRYRVWQEDGSIETWTLDLTGTDEIVTPDGKYQALTFRLGNDVHWIAGWSVPLLVFHFARLEFWENGERTWAMDLEAKELWE